MPYGIELDGKWEVALKEYSHPNKWENIISNVEIYFEKFLEELATITKTDAYPELYKKLVEKQRETTHLMDSICSRQYM